MRIRNLFSGVLGLVLAAGNCGADVISEFQPNPTGGDPANQTIELFGTAGATASGFLYSIESDAVGTRGRIDRQEIVSGTYDPNGILELSIPDLENPSFTIVYSDTNLSEGFDVDADNDGLIDDVGVFGTVYDAVGITDTANASEPLYAAQLGGQDLGFIGTEPVLVFRDASGGDWYQVDFADLVYDAAGNSVDPNSFNMNPAATTFGAINPTTNFTPVPEPSGIGLIAVTGLIWFRRRKLRRSKSA